MPTLIGLPAQLINILGWLLMNSQTTIEMPVMRKELATVYPHVWKKIVEDWGSLMCPQYLKQLVIVEPNRDRDGFSSKAIRELLSLIAQHDRLFPHHSIIRKSIKSEVWNRNGGHWATVTCASKWHRPGVFARNQIYRGRSKKPLKTLNSYLHP